VHSAGSGPSVRVYQYDYTEMRTEEHPEIPACLCTNEFARGRPGLDVSRISVISSGLGRKCVDAWVLVACVDGRPWHSDAQNLSTPLIPNGLFTIPSDFQVTWTILEAPVSQGRMRCCCTAGMPIVHLIILCIDPIAAHVHWPSQKACKM
jgi:hypothetical protein